MRRLDSAIPVGHQLLTRVTNLCVSECVSKYGVFDRASRDQKHFRIQSLPGPQRKTVNSQVLVLTHS